MIKFRYYWNNEDQMWTVQKRLFFVFWVDDRISFSCLEMCRDFVYGMNKKPN